MKLCSLLLTSTLIIKCGSFLNNINIQSKPLSFYNIRYSTIQEEAQEQEQSQIFSEDEDEDDIDNDDINLQPIRRYKPIRRKRTPVIAIIGRPNVGKSALVNRIAGTQSGGAIVADESGITRDRTYRNAEFLGERFQIVDTGGLVFDDIDRDTGNGQELLFAKQIREQAMIALDESSAAIFVVDGQTGLTDMDSQLADFLRKDVLKDMPVLVAVNKCESEKMSIIQTAEFWKLGLGEPHAVSAIHGVGVAELLENIYEEVVEKKTAIPGFGSKVKNLKKAQDDVVKAYKGELEDDTEMDQFLRQYGLNTDDRVIKQYEDAMAAFDHEDYPEEINIAIIGRPNVGKSSLLNSIFGDNRAIVSPIAGTTRDSIDAIMERPPPPNTPNATSTLYRFIDTAGIRRKGKVAFGPEFYMVNRALRAIRRSDVVLLITDATAGITEQDRILAQKISIDGRACVILCNKWDAVTNKDTNTYQKSVQYIREELPQVKWAPIVFISATTGQRVNKIYSLVDTAIKAHRKRISTSVLNDILRDAILWQPPPVKRSGVQLKIYYCHQVSTRPPTIIVYVNNVKLVTDNYKRFLDRKFRESLSGFESTPIRWIFRGKRVRDMRKGVGNGDPGKSTGTNYPFPHAG